MKAHKKMKYDFVCKSDPVSHINNRETTARDKRASASRAGEQPHTKGTLIFHALLDRNEETTDSKHHDAYQREARSASRATLHSINISRKSIIGAWREWNSPMGRRRKFCARELSISPRKDSEVQCALNARRILFSLSVRLLLALFSGSLLFSLSLFSGIVCAIAECCCCRCCSYSTMLKLLKDSVTFFLLLLLLSSCCCLCCLCAQKI
jgi:hypothetical protein